MRTFSTSMRVYISGPLQAAADLSVARAFYDRLAQTCREMGWEPYTPHQHTDPQRHGDVPSDVVFERDYAQLQAADIVVACVGTPSSGVGAEMGIAFLRETPMIALYQRSERPSRFILGLLGRATNTQLVPYDDPEHACQQLKATLMEYEQRAVSEA